MGLFIRTKTILLLPSSELIFLTFPVAVLTPVTGPADAFVTSLKYFYQWNIFCSLKYFYLAALLADTAALPALVSLAGIPHSVHGRQLVRIQLTPGRHLKIFQCRKYFGCENISVVQIVLKYSLIMFDKKIFVKIILQLAYYLQVLVAITCFSPKQTWAVWQICCD